MVKKHVLMSSTQVTDHDVRYPFDVGIGHEIKVYLSITLLLFMSSIHCRVYLSTFSHSVWLSVPVSVLTSTNDVLSLVM